MNTKSLQSYFEGTLGKAELSGYRVHIVASSPSQEPHRIVFSPDKPRLGWVTFVIENPFGKPTLNFNVHSFVYLGDTERISRQLTTFFEIAHEWWDYKIKHNMKWKQS